MFGCNDNLSWDFDILAEKSALEDPEIQPIHVELGKLWGFLLYDAA